MQHLAVKVTNAYTIDVRYEGAVCWHLQPVLCVRFVTPIIVHWQANDEDDGILKGIFGPSSVACPRKHFRSFLAIFLRALT